MTYRYKFPCLFAAIALQAWQTAPSETWTFDSLDQIGGHPATILGHPRIIETPKGKAIQFNGVDDAIFLNVHPLAGAETFTWEVVFRPDSDGAPEQRFFHLQEKGTNTRLLFETRVTARGWYLDSFALSGSTSKALMDSAKLHTTDAWHHAAAVYDGKEFRNYVDGKLQGAATVHLVPQGPGETSIGTRINKKDYFKGAVRIARMTRRPLEPADFLKW